MKKFMIMLLAAGMLVFSAVAVNAATKTPVATSQQQTCSCCKEGCTCGDCDKCKATKCNCCKEGCTCGDCDKCKATKCNCCKEGCTCGDCDKCKATKCNCCKEGCTCGDCDKCKATCDDNKCTSEQKCTKKGCKAKKSK